MKKFGIIMLVIGLIAMFTTSFAAEQEGRESVKNPMAEKQAIAKAVKISMANALAIASKQVSGTVMGMELENENGKTIYSFEILPTLSSKIIKEVNIDAVNGSVVGIEEENPASEAKEKSAESKEKMSKGSKEKESIDEEKEEKGEKGKDGDKWEPLKIKVEVTVTKQGKLIEKESKEVKKAESKEKDEQGEKDEKD